MDFQTLARERFSVLHYERRDVPQELVHVILDAALAAPTACNRLLRGAQSYLGHVLGPRKAPSGIRLG